MDLLHTFADGAVLFAGAKRFRLVALLANNRATPRHKSLHKKLYLSGNHWGKAKLCRASRVFYLPELVYYSNASAISRSFVTVFQFRAVPCAAQILFTLAQDIFALPIPLEQ